MALAHFGTGWKTAVLADSKRQGMKKPTILLDLELQKSKQLAAVSGTDGHSARGHQGDSNWEV